MMTTERTFLRTLAVIAGIQLIGWASVQVAAQEPQMRQVETLPPSTNPTNQLATFNPAADEELGATTDLGAQVILQRRPWPPLFSVYSDSQYLFNSNIGLTPNHQVSDGLFFETLGAAFTPRLLDGLGTALYARQQFILYNNQSAQDFDAQTAGLSLTYAVKDWFTLYGGFAATRLFASASEHEFYKEFDTQLGLWHSQILMPRLSLYCGYQMDWLPASPSSLTEVDNALYAGLNWELLTRLNAQFLYRLRVREYLQASRTDIDHLLSLAVTYTFNQYVSAHTYASYGVNDSNQSVFNYNVANGGAGLTLSVRF